MVIGAFPAAKLGTLLIKQISKPIANYIKYQAKSSPVFRTYVCMPPAQFYNWCEVKTKMWILNLGKPVNIPVLNEAMAIELGANLLGEAIIFFIAAGVLVAEYSRSARKEAAKEQAKQDEMNALNTELQELFFQMEEQRVQIKELLRTVSEMETQVIKKPWSGSKDKDSSDDEPPSPPAPSIEFSPKKTISTSINPPASKEPAGDKSGNILLRAIHIVEHEFLTNPDSQRDIGILTLALNHLYQDVYKLPGHVLM